MTAQELATAFRNGQGSSHHTRNSGPTRSSSSGLSSISGSIRCLEFRLASSTVGCTASIGPGAWWIAKPIQLLPASVAPTCAAFMKTIRWVGSPGDSRSMISPM